MMLSFLGTISKLAHNHVPKITPLARVEEKQHRIITAHEPSAFAIAFPAFLLFSLQQAAPRVRSSSSSRRVSRRLEQRTHGLSAMNETVHGMLTRATKLVLYDQGAFRQAVALPLSLCSRLGRESNLTESNSPSFALASSLFENRCEQSMSPGWCTASPVCPPAIRLRSCVWCSACSCLFDMCGFDLRFESSALTMKPQR